MRAESLNYISVERDLYLAAINRLEELTSLVERINAVVGYDIETEFDFVIDLRDRVYAA